MGLIDRTLAFSLTIEKLCADLPRNATQYVVGHQLLRSSASPSAHFREALRARSKAEYVSKLAGGVMELEESLHWLEMLKGANLVSDERLEPLVSEANQLIAIFVSLIKKWRPKKKTN